MKKVRIERHFCFWQMLNNLPLEKYLRAQRLCQKFLGGWVRGFGAMGLVVEK